MFKLNSLSWKAHCFPYISQREDDALLIYTITSSIVNPHDLTLVLDNGGFVMPKPPIVYIYSRHLTTVPDLCLEPIIQDSSSSDLGFRDDDLLITLHKGKRK